MAENALLSVQQRLDHIIEFLPDATLVVDNEHRVIAWNRAIEGMTGVPKEDILGKSGYEYSVPFYGYQRPILLDFIGKDPSSRLPHVCAHPGQLRRVDHRDSRAGPVRRDEAPTCGPRLRPCTTRTATSPEPSRQSGTSPTKNASKSAPRCSIWFPPQPAPPGGRGPVLQGLRDPVRASAHRDHVRLPHKRAGAILTYPFFSRQSLARHETLKHLSTLSTQARKSQVPASRKHESQDLKRTRRSPNSGSLPPALRKPAARLRGHRDPRQQPLLRQGRTHAGLRGRPSGPGHFPQRHGTGPASEREEAPRHFRKCDGRHLPDLPRPRSLERQPGHGPHFRV
jgi:hypothetical protein